MYKKERYNKLAEESERNSISFLGGMGGKPKINSVVRARLIHRSNPLCLHVFVCSSSSSDGSAWETKTTPCFYLFNSTPPPRRWPLMGLSTELIFSISSDTCLPVRGVETTGEAETTALGWGSNDGISSRSPSSSSLPWVMTICREKD